jgi:hypothetical protein
MRNEMNKLVTSLAVAAATVTLAMPASAEQLFLTKDDLIKLENYVVNLKAELAELQSSVDSLTDQLAVETVRADEAESTVLVLGAENDILNQKLVVTSDSLNVCSADLADANLKVGVVTDLINDEVNDRMTMTKDVINRIITD